MRRPKLSSIVYTKEKSVSFYYLRGRVLFLGYTSEWPCFRGDSSSSSRPKSGKSASRHVTTRDPLTPSNSLPSLSFFFHRRVPERLASHHHAPIYNGVRKKGLRQSLKYIYIMFYYMAPRRDNILTRNNDH